MEYSDGNRVDGLLRIELSAEFDHTAKRLRTRIEAYRNSTRRDPNFLALLTEFDNNLTVCLTCVSSSPMPLRDICRGVAELQRSWLYLVAVLDYLEIYRSRTLGMHERGNAEVENRIGAFVWNDHDALELWNAGLPIYFVRPYSTFHNQVILTVKPLIMPRLCVTAASPPYPILLSNSQVGSDQKFAAIHTASISCFDVSSPFENMHLPGLYSSSYTPGGSIGSIVSTTRSSPSTSLAGPSRTTSTTSPSSPYSTKLEHCQRGKKHRINPPQTPHSLFSDLSHPLLPPLLTPWRDMNSMIDTQHPLRQHSPGKSQKLLTIVPDPAMICGSSEDRLGPLLEQWSQLRGPWLTQCRDRNVQVEPKSNAVWKKALSIHFIGTWPEGKTPKTNADHDHHEASRLVSTLLPSHQPLPNLPPSSSDASRSRHLLHELSLINFRYQVIALDLVADQSVPKASPSLSQAELMVALANHSRSRGQLIDRIFGNAGDIFSVSQALFVNGFAAEKWSDRVDALRAFASLMHSWQGDKSSIWNRRDDPNLPVLLAPGSEWENVLIKFFVQAYFNHFGHPPILPRGCL
ncbi:hypothetical protein E1B28_003334 [Marasmius oreades]|uniref:Uncharacterized protein n=1 Tax=Marasmius oreades TaxID=181124 RepID=A0A9P7RMC4_9AGAR|nr:uncharacterized protein E1B28_003334 [Marasmius oreades]KAG7085793.1 hypothetical protein E1B28_003334 [Marasmius oreades]